MNRKQAALQSVFYCGECQLQFDVASAAKHTATLDHEVLRVR